MTDTDIDIDPIEATNALSDAVQVFEGLSDDLASELVDVTKGVERLRLLGAIARINSTCYTLRLLRDRSRN